MLIRFQVANHRSIKDPVELSMVAVDRNRVEARAQPLLGESLVPVAGIYGPNASGKTNVVAALDWLCNAVAFSLRGWESEIPVDPFAFDNDPRNPTQFEIELIMDRVRFEYVLEVDAEHVSYEALFHYPLKSRKRVFEREDQSLKLQRGLGNLAGAKQLMTPQTLFLSAARRSGESIANAFANQLVSMQIVGPALMWGKRSGGGRSHLWPKQTMWLFQESSMPTLFEPESPNDLGYPKRELALAMLRMADLGIEDVTIREQQVQYTDTGETDRVRRQVFLLHQVGKNREPIDYSEESDGTRAWFTLIGPTLETLRKGTVLVVDELDSSLHPTLSCELLKLFHSPQTNPLGAQLIFTAHDTSLLDHLNRDEVWFTEKQPDGATRLGPLSDFAGSRVRKSVNLEAGYLGGRFGALPHVDQADLLRSLGLIG